LAEDGQESCRGKLVATERDLEPIAKEVARRKGKILRKEDIALKAGRAVSLSKVAKHLGFTTEDRKFHWEYREELIRQEAALDGTYCNVVRSSESKKLSRPRMPCGATRA
jgi:hypothetical protein